MNPGPVEEAAGVAKDTISALNKYPLLLTMVIFQIAILVVIGWVAHERSMLFQEQFKVLVDRCGPRQGENIPLPPPKPGELNPG